MTDCPAPTDMSVIHDESFRLSNQKFSQIRAALCAPAVCLRRRRRAVGARSLTP